ncbi:molecular chaperone [Rhodoferax sp.]|uniref:molecular chaperone n=1 Tax=Rhodoferax sp. TaxID=50421 RepID=UPI002723F569|nr:molecular chaperone [Rhodoferax sp.]MDO9144650.1 molecular chaperone [Rhodoferax sp.]MDP1527762.1 molecular chaperone [Rhodoferax sp.]MDP1945223.1 molecular chaperone [Rhodoferax sp.]MDP2442952.1 molecular chaperone [Rhodoferax sp.]MDP3191691.1 molecular chaperone [Rhodoferax sp.]
MKNIVSTGALALALLLGAQSARADLMLYPTRVELEKNQRAAQVELVNRGTKSETYRISIVNRRMTETGEIVEAKEAQPGEQFASPMLSYSPRQVTLQPGVGQTVRISVRKPADLATGEYRSHLQFDRVADAEGQSSLEAVTEPEEGQIAIVLQALVGASIPVIVRHGDTAVTAMLEDLKVEPANEKVKTPVLVFAIRRDGNRSVYGDLVVEFAAAGARPVALARVAGVAVYVPNIQRLARMPLTLPDGLALKNGTLTLRFSTRPDAGAKLLAQATLALP